MFLLAFVLGAGSGIVTEPEASCLFLLLGRTVSKVIASRKSSWTFYFLAAPCAACENLVPCPGIKPTPSALEAQNLNHWTTREVPLLYFLNLQGWRFHNFPSNPSAHPKAERTLTLRELSCPPQGSLVVWKLIHQFKAEIV